jgi:hypothetical protein
MTKEELFKKYNIDESHNIWENRIDNWMPIEVYRVMHNGDLPPQDGSDKSLKYILDFLDKGLKEPMWLMTKKNWGSLWLTAKRMVYKLSDEILKEINYGL